MPFSYILEKNHGWRETLIRLCCVTLGLHSLSTSLLGVSCLKCVNTVYLHDPIFPICFISTETILKLEFCDIYLTFTCDSKSWEEEQTVKTLMTPIGAIWSGSSLFPPANLGKISIIVLVIKAHQNEIFWNYKSLNTDFPQKSIKFWLRDQFFFSTLA